jgi:MOSC domain-containing protein YiiM
MQVVSVNVGLPREVRWKGEKVTTGIFKEPVEGRARVRTLNLDGDRQADLSVHGGPDKAVYVYPSEHYTDWSRELPDVPLPWAMFGENLTTEGLREDSVHIGDRLRAGTAELVVTQPRTPCYKLGIRFGRDEIVRQFLESGRTGFYCAVLREGDVEAGDAIEWTHRDPHQVSVAEIHRLNTSERNNRELLQRALAVESLSQAWQDYLRQQLHRLEG